ncbi:MAG: ribosomal protein S18-alanine N-acetyltransferase, partial [Gemmatimonadota bacterium]|nr:ribosomal protein S18-alanine N-acetyltransferase [Gemmatimonadota bacterium]
MDAPCRIQAASSADLGAVARIEATAFPDPWSAEQFGSHLGDLFLVAVAAGEVIGYLVAWSVGVEAEILNVAVAPDVRRRGTARTLLTEALAKLGQAGVTSVFLEVRPSNVAARHLYASVGFREVARRRGYYATPREDALVLRREGHDG